MKTAAIRAGVRYRAVYILVASHEYEGTWHRTRTRRSSVGYSRVRVLSSAGWRTCTRIPLLVSGASRSPPAEEAEAGRATSLRHEHTQPPSLGETVLCADTVPSEDEGYEYSEYNECRWIRSSTAESVSPRALAGRQEHVYSATRHEIGGDMGRYGEIWGGTGRYGEVLRF